MTDSCLKSKKKSRFTDRSHCVKIQAMQIQNATVNTTKTRNGWSAIIVLMTKRKSIEILFNAAMDRVAASYKLVVKKKGSISIYLNLEYLDLIFYIVTWNCLLWSTINLHRRYNRRNIGTDNSTSIGTSACDIRRVSAWMKGQRIVPVPADK